MYNAHKPSVDELPTSAQLLRSTAIAIAAAAAILVTIVLPSEYGVDPTGIGGVLGLAQMGDIKLQLAAEAEYDRRQEVEIAAQMNAGVEQMSPAIPTGTSQADAPNTDSIEQRALTTQPSAENPPAAPNEPEATLVSEAWRDEISITLTPGEGAEVKLVMEAGAQARFEWTANGAVLNYDTHGDGGGRSISYEKGRGTASDEGVLEAAFDGNHGWFWRNRTAQNVTMTLRTTGNYGELKRLI